MPDTKQIAVTLTPAQKEIIREGGLGLPLTGEQIRELRSALQAEQKPEEPKWVESESAPRVFNPTHVAPPVPAPVEQTEGEDETIDFAKIARQWITGDMEDNCIRLESLIRSAYDKGRARGRADLITELMREIPKMKQEAAG